MCSSIWYTSTILPFLFKSLSVVLREILGSWSVHTSDDNVISFIGFEGHLIDRSEFLLSQDLNFVSVDNLWCDSRVDTRGLNSNDEVSSVLDEH